jgi:hypothetical protein
MGTKALKKLTGHFGGETINQARPKLRQLSTDFDLTIIV